MKISVFYEHIEKACEQTKKPLEEVLEHVKKSGIDGIHYGVAIGIRLIIQVV